MEVGRVDAMMAERCRRDLGLATRNDSLVSAPSSMVVRFFQKATLNVEEVLRFAL